MRLFLPKKNKGQSLIEVVVAVGITTLLSVALLSVVSISIKNSRVAKDRTIAVELAQEGIELMRTYRDYNWIVFLSKATGTNYDLPISWIVESSFSDCPADVFAILNTFKRCVTLTKEGIGDDNVKLGVTVSWWEGNKLNQVVQSSQLSKWQR